MLLADGGPVARDKPGRITFHGAKSCWQDIYANVPPEKRTVYRIRIEEGVEVNTEHFNADEARAIARLRNILAKWPTDLWLASNNGKLILVIL